LLQISSKTDRLARKPRGVAPRNVRR
jgi:non-ribosomal peptide synthetase component F